MLQRSGNRWWDFYYLDVERSCPNETFIPLLLLVARLLKKFFFASKADEKYESANKEIFVMSIMRRRMKDGGAV